MYIAYLNKCDFDQTVILFFGQKNPSITLGILIAYVRTDICLLLLSLKLDYVYREV